MKQMIFIANLTCRELKVKIRKYIEKNCASRWSFTKNHYMMRGQQNVIFCVLIVIWCCLPIWMRSEGFKHATNIAQTIELCLLKQSWGLNTRERMKVYV